MASHVPDVSLPATMSAMLLTGHGDVNRLVYRDDVPVPRPGHRHICLLYTSPSPRD